MESKRLDYSAGKNAEFVAHIELVLDVYKRPYDADFPVVCMDESPGQLIETLREETMGTGQRKSRWYPIISARIP